MDKILLELFRSPLDEPLRVAAIRRITAIVLATHDQRAALSDRVIGQMVGAGAQMLAAAQSSDMARAALHVIQKFAECSLSSVLDRADDCILQPLFLSRSSSPSVHCISSVFELMNWLLAVSTDSQQQLVFVSVLAHQLPQLAVWMGAGGLTAAEWLAALTVWLLDENMAVLKSCEQQGDSVLLVDSLVAVLTSVPSPTGSAQVALYKRRMTSVRRLLTHLLAIDNSHVTRVMHRLHKAMADSHGERYTGLSVVLLSLPQPVIQPACTELVRQHMSGGSSLLTSLQLLCDWIILWPRECTLSIWLLLLIRQLSAAGQSQLLGQLTEARATQLFNALMMPALRRTVFPIVFILLLGYQHSSEIFVKVQSMACVLVQQLRSDAPELRELADLLYTLIHQHCSSCDTSPLILALKDIDSPPVERMNALLREAAWRSVPSSSPNIDNRLVLSTASGRPSATPSSMAVVRHRGLTNLGNTCFMNSIIQALFAVNSFREAVLWSSPAPHHRLLSALQRVFAFLQFSALPVYSPSAFHQLALPPWFERGQQHDCYEFLRYILNALHEEQFCASAPKLSPTIPKLRCVGYDDSSRSAGDMMDTSAGIAHAAARCLRRCSQSSTTGHSGATDDEDDDDCVMADGAGDDEVSGVGDVRCSEGSHGTERDHKVQVGISQSEFGGRRSPSTVLPSDGDIVSSADFNTGASPVFGATAESSLSAASDCSSLVPVASSESVLTCSPASLSSVNGSPLTPTTVFSDSSTSGISSCSPPPPNSPTVPPSSPHLQIAPETLTMLSASPTPSPSSCTTTSTSTVAAPATVRCPDAEHRCSLVQRLLTGQMETTYRCLGCDGVSRHVDEFTDINLTFPERVDCRAPSPPLVMAEPTGGGAGQVEVVSDRLVPLNQQDQRQVSVRQVVSADGETSSPSLHVGELFEHYLSRERLTGENRYWCSSCTTLCDADRQLRVLSPPVCLLVSLARFVYDRSAASHHKLLTPVRLGRHLQVPVESSAGGGVSHAVYSLQAVVVHTGVSLDAGHYYCCARTDGDECDARMDAEDADGEAAASADGDWWCFSDSSVTPVQLADVLQITERRPCDTAYLLVYVRHAPPSSPNSDGVGSGASTGSARLSRQMRQLPEGLLRAIRMEGGIK